MGTKKKHLMKVLATQTHFDYITVHKYQLIIPTITFEFGKDPFVWSQINTSFLLSIAINQFSKYVLSTYIVSKL